MYELNLSLVNPQGVNYIFIGCHVIAMTTTITNPILYGWLNTNLKHLFRYTYGAS